MKAYDILSENKAFILEQHFKKSNQLVESICYDLTKEQKIVVEGIYKEFRPLIEASLTADQIQKIFTDAEAGATAAGGNRTAIGKGKDIAGAGVDAVKKANEIINKLGAKLQDTTPVKAFDQKFEQLKAKVAEKFPDLAKKTEGLGEWVKANPGKSAAVIGVLTAIASLAGGPVGGAIAGQVLKGAQELLKGEKLSTAVGKGIKAAAVGWLAGKSMEAIGKMISGAFEHFNPIPIDASRKFYSVNVGNGLPSTFQDATFYGSKEQLGQFKGLWGDAVKQWNSGDYEGAKAAFDQARQFAQQASDATLNQIAINGDPAEKLKLLNQALAGLSAAAQGAATGATGMDKEGKPKQESKDLSLQQIKTIIEWCNGSPKIIMEGPLDAVKGALSKGVSAVSNKAQQVGKNITTKVTADKLNSAWKKAGSPTDSDAVAKVLRDAGVSDEVLSPIFKTLKIKLPPAGQEAPADNQQPASTPAQAPAGAENKMDYKSLQAAVAQLRTRDAQSLLKFIDSIDGAAKTAKPKAAPVAEPQAKQPAATATPPEAPAAPATKNNNVKIVGKKAPPAKPKVAVAV